MAYLHCHSCGWSQDDFWAEGGYNPIRFLQDDRDLESYLFRDKIYFDEWMLKEMGIKYGRDEKGYYCSGKDYTVYELRRTAKKIEGMLVSSSEEWKKLRDHFKCPKCGQQDWDID